MFTGICIFLLSLLPEQVARAAAVVCPLCAVAIASGLGLSKFLGVSDCVLAIWFGAMLFAIYQMNVRFLEKWNIKSIYSIIIGAVTTCCLILPLYIGENPVLNFNERTILGVDEFLFSTMLGILVLSLSLESYKIMKKKNGKPHFQFERVVLPVASLVACSVLINYLRS